MGQHLVELAGGVAAHVARARRDALEERARRQVHVARSEVVAVGSHALEDVGQRLGHVQVARADARLPRRVVVVEDRHALLGVGRRGQRRVAQPAAHRRRHPGGDGLAGDDGQAGVGIGAALLAAHDGGRDQPRQLRHRDLERPLEHRQAARRGAPLGLAPAVEADQADDRDVEVAERPACLRAREAEHERERHVRPRRPLGVEEQRFEGDGGGIAEDRDRLRALPLDLGDDGVEDRGVARVVLRLVEPDGHARSPRPELAGGAAPRVERLPGREDAPRPAVRVVVAGIEARLRIGHRQPGDARRRQRLLEQADLVLEPLVRPERAGALVPCDAALDVVLARQQPLADPEHEPPARDALDEIDAVLRREALQHLLVHDVENEHVGLEEGVDVGVVEERLGEELDRDAAAQIGVLLEDRPVRAEGAGEVAVGEQVGDARLLGVRRSRGERERHDQRGGASPRMHSCASHAAPLSRARRRSVRRRGDRRCRAALPARRGSRRSARRR